MPNSMQTVENDAFFSQMFAESEESIVTPDPTPPVATLEAQPESTKPETEGRIIPIDQLGDQIFDLDDEEPAPATSQTPTPQQPPVNPPSTEKTPDKPTEEETEEGDDESQNRKQVFKAMAQHLIKKGIWQDIEGGIDNIDGLDDEQYAQLAEMQDTFRLDQKWGSIKQSSELIGGLVDYLEAGGEPDKFIDLVKEQRTIQAIDTSTETGQRQMIERYYRDIMELDDKTIARKMKKLSDDGEEEFQAEFEIAQAKYGTYFQKQQEKLVSEAKEAELLARQQKLQRAQSTYQQLTTLGLTKDKAQGFIRNLFEEKYQLPDGTRITEYDKRMLDIQNNPEEHAELVQFILDKKGYLARKAQKEVNKVVDNTFTGLQLKPKTARTQSVQPGKASTSEADAFLLKAAGIQ